MKIGLIGAGNIGGALVPRFTALGHQVLVSNSRGPQSLAAPAAETGATAVDRAQAVAGVYLIVLTIPRGRSRTCRRICSPACRPASR